MAFKVTKLPGAARLCSFRHDDKMIHPTLEGVVLATRPADAVFRDPWMKVEEVASSELEAFAKLEAKNSKEAKAAEKKAKAAEGVRASKDANLAKQGIAAKSASDRAKALTQLKAERAALNTQLAANPGRAASVKMMLEDLDAREELLSENVSEEEELRTNGPTLAEYVKAGYQPSNYPPQGYAAKPFEPAEMESLQAEWDKAKAEAAKPEAKNAKASKGKS